MIKMNGKSSKKKIFTHDFKKLYRKNTYLDVISRSKMRQTILDYHPVDLAAFVNDN